MATIEERARAEGYRAMDAAAGLDDNVVITQPNGMTFNGLPEYIGNVASQAYKDGATEQRKIDVDKACKWWSKLTNKGNKSEIAFPVTDGWIAEFRKAMEE